MSTKMKALSLFDGAILGRAAGDAVRKLDPRKLARNPVIFVTEVVSLVVTILFLRDLVTRSDVAFFTGQIAAWLWFTVLFANFAEAVAEGRGKAQADTLRRMRSDTMAKRLVDPNGRQYQSVNSLDLKIGDVVLVEAGDLIPSDGEVIEGIASINESAITGESAPVIRESGGDRSAVTGGTTVLSDWVKVKITAAPGSTFLDRMIALVEGAERQKTPNEIALSILLSGLTLDLPRGLRDLVVPRRLFRHDAHRHRADRASRVPDPDDDRRPAFGHRHRRHGPVDPLQRRRHLGPRGRGRGRCRHAAPRQDGHHHLRQPHGVGVHPRARRHASASSPRRRLLASLADETPEGRSIVAYARSKYGFAERTICAEGMTFVPFSAHTRMSGVDFGARTIRKGAVDAILRFAGIAMSRRPRPSARRSTGSRAPAARRSRSPRMGSCSASCISRTR